MISFKLYKRWKEIEEVQIVINGEAISRMIITQSSDSWKKAVRMNIPTLE